MKRASYKEAIAWIAMNDGPGDSWAMDVEQMKGQTSVVLIADLFGKPAREVAEKVVEYRRLNL